MRLGRGYLRIWGPCGRRRARRGIAGNRPVRRAHPRRTDPSGTGAAAAEIDAERHRRGRAIALPAGQSRVQRRPGDHQQRRFQQSEGRDARGDAGDLGRFRRHRASGLRDLRNPRPRRHLFAQQGLSGRGPGADPAHRERPGPPRAALCAGDDHPRARRDRRRRGQARRLSRQADRGRDFRPQPGRALSAAGPRPARLQRPAGPEARRHRPRRTGRRGVGDPPPLFGRLHGLQPGGAGNRPLGRPAARPGPWPDRARRQHLRLHLFDERLQGAADLPGGAQLPARDRKGCR